MAGKAGRSGPRAGNLNALKTATKVGRRLVVGELPKQLLSVKREARAYRRGLEDAVLAAHNEITTTHSHHIDTASAATIHGGICRWLMRTKIATMNTAEILACSRELVKAKAARDAAVRLLDLDRPPANPWDVI
ncbi:MAG: hypothetical protein KJ749_10055, partial [Planctomycetes bacterium]|nr:hypothetical protein [Planctomycetota bacterium]